MTDLKTWLQAARRAGAPLLAVSTPNQPGELRPIVEALQEDGAEHVLRWTCLDGLTSLTGSKGLSVIAAMVPDGADPASVTSRIEGALELLVKLPAGCAVLFENAHLFLDPRQNPLPVQGLMSLRDRFKENERQLILLGPSFQLPGEVAGDFLCYDVPLPDAQALEEIVTSVYRAAVEGNAKLPKLAQATTAKAVSALQGLNGFGAEQVVATSIRAKTGLDTDALWEKKRQVIAQTRGLSVWAGKDGFDKIGGCGAVKTYLSELFAGPEPPEAIVFMDEIDKAMAGSSGGDTSGVSQDMLGAVLSYMDGTSSRTVPGMIELGPPGAAKSAVAKAAGAQFGVPTIVFDFGGMKDSLVGESGKNVRNALKIVDAVSNGRAYVIATCNAVEVLKSELRRRFTSEWFFDLPTAEDRDAIWKIWTAAFKIEDKDRPDDTGWTGAEIRKACWHAYLLRRSLREAAKVVVPVSVSAREPIERLRQSASGKFLDASKEGTYTYSALESKSDAPAENRKRVVKT